MSTASVGVRASKANRPPPPGVPSDAVPLIGGASGPFWEQYVFTAAGVGAISFEGWENGGGLSNTRDPMFGGGTTIRFRTVGDITGTVTAGKNIYIFFAGFLGSGSSGSGSGIVNVLTTNLGGSVLDNFTSVSSIVRPFGASELFVAPITNVTNLRNVQVTLSMSSAGSTFTSYNRIGYIGVA